MANEFWNVVAGILAGIVIGLVLHSSASHVYDELLWRLFHPNEERKKKT